MGSLIQLGGFVPALSEPITRGCEGSKVGAIPIEEGMPQKTARKKLFMMRNGATPDVGPPLSPGACEVRSPRPPNGHLWAPRVDQVAYLSGMERQGCSWGVCRESEGRSSLYKATHTAPVRSHAPVFAPALGPTPDKIAHCATCTDPGGVPKPHTKAFTRVTRVTKSPIHREHREHRETERARERPPSPHRNSWDTPHFHPVTACL
jgi:hypothetical protein